MIRCLMGFLLLGSAAACVSDMPAISSMNFVQEAVDPSCAYAAVSNIEGFAVADGIATRGGARQFQATFNQTIPVSVIVRNLDDGTSEVSTFSRHGQNLSPLKRREIVFAVKEADEAIYRACTVDGKSSGDPANIIIETTENN